MLSSNVSRAKIIKDITIIFLVSLVVGSIIGAGVNFVSKIVYLIVIFPIAIGFAGGFTVEGTIVKFKIRGQRIGLVFGILIGLIAYGAYHYASYISFQNELTGIFSGQLLEQHGQIDQTTLYQLVDRFLIDETGQQGFLGFIFLSAKEGVSIASIYGGKFVNIGTFLTVLYWIFELGLIIYFAADMGKSAAEKPFCETCNDWYGKYEHIGAAPISEVDDIQKLLEMDNYYELGRSLIENVEIPSIDVYIQGCTNCNTNPFELVIKLAKLDSKGEVILNQIFKSSISPSQREALFKGLNREESITT